MSEFVVKFASAGLDPSGMLQANLQGEATVVQYNDGVTLADQVADAHVLLTRSDPVTSDVIDAAPDLRLIQRPGVTVFDVDQSYAAKRGVPVCNVPANLLLEAQVGEHATTLMLAMVKRLPEALQVMRERNVVSQPPNRSVEGKTLGLIGVGRTALPLLNAAKALGMKVIAVKRDASEAVRAELGLEWVGTFDEIDHLLEASDIVSIHLPLNDATRGRISSDELSRLRPGAYVVNVARAAIVDYDAIREAVTSGHLAGYATDVWWSEPAQPDDDFVEHPAVLATPHVASAAIEGQERMWQLVADNIRRVIAGQAPLYQTNAPGGEAA